MGGSDEGEGGEQGGGGGSHGGQMPLPLAVLADCLGREVKISYWEGKDLKKKSGVLAAFDAAGNVVLAMKKKVIWYRGATVQSIAVAEA